MRGEWTPEKLIAFEDAIAAEFNAGKIPHPVHLAGGNEAQLIDIFDEDVAPGDWVLCSWRAHYHALLHGVPPNEVRDAIRAGRSIALCFPAYRVLSSAIVGGICPLAAGIAWSIKRRAGNERVWCFVGDMTAMTGIFHEANLYAYGHDLPVSWVIEDNGKSVLTATKDVWKAWIDSCRNGEVHYKYQLTRPHVGTGQFVRF